MFGPDELGTIVNQGNPVGNRSDGLCSGGGFPLAPKGWQCSKQRHGRHAASPLGSVSNNRSGSDLGDVYRVRRSAGPAAVSTRSTAGAVAAERAERALRISLAADPQADLSAHRPWSPLVCRRSRTASGPGQCCERRWKRGWLGEPTARPRAVAEIVSDHIFRGIGERPRSPEALRASASRAWPSWRGTRGVPAARRVLSPWRGDSRPCTCAGPTLRASSSGRGWLGRRSGPRAPGC